MLRRALAATADAEVSSSWISSWVYVQWTLLIAACIASLYLAIHSITLYQLKKRTTDLVLLVIGLSDFAFSALEVLKQYLEYSYVGVYDREVSGVGRKPVETGELLLGALSRFGFFMSISWVVYLSLVMRETSTEFLYIRRNFFVSLCASAVYGAMFSSLQSIDNRFGYTMNAVVLLAIQVSTFLTIAANVKFVKQTRINENNQGRNVIQRLAVYCVCAAWSTLPFMVALVASQEHVGFGAVTESFNYVLPIANAILFGTSIVCCCQRPESKEFDSRKTESLNNGPHLLESLHEMITEGPVVKIGEGSSAVVYKTQWLGITVAMKCIRLQGAEAANFQELYMTYVSDVQSEFCDEAALAAQLRHPNITLFIKLGSYKGSMCLVNEYCARGSLRDVLKANPLLDWSTKVRLAFEAAKGLAFMHNREPIYLHRDIKASNILVTEDWTAKISDFGISRIATDYRAVAAKKVNRGHGIQEEEDGEEDTSDVTTFAGTWRWNAPEVMKNPNECRFNRATDVYSFGVALWEILTNGSIPFSDIAFDHQVRTLVANGERPRFPPGALRRAPPEFVELIKKCWHQKPDRRATAQEIMLKLGSLEFTLSNADNSSRGMSRQAFSDNYYQALDSSRSFV
uniref:Protein kinase domain-containing protein n=1 Tax=Globisporangium ultimum (strain ATCC 200006 / CBS 805.95 / DAOM BR144) TaxID=431595 RepID=K3X166_GLOUD